MAGCRELPAEDVLGSDTSCVTSLVVVGCQAYSSGMRLWEIDQQSCVFQVDLWAAFTW